MYAAHVPAGDGPFPAILALHGWGASAHDLMGLSPFLHGGRALVLCPQGPIQVPIGSGMVGYGWFPLKSGTPTDPAYEKSVGRFLDELLWFTEAIAARRALD